MALLKKETADTLVEKYGISPQLHQQLTQEQAIANPLASEFTAKSVEPTPQELIEQARKKLSFNNPYLMGTFPREAPSEDKVIDEAVNMKTARVNRGKEADTQKQLELAAISKLEQQKQTLGLPFDPSKIISPTKPVNEENKILKTVDGFGMPSFGSGIDAAYAGQRSAIGKMGELAAQQGEAEAIQLDAMSNKMQEFENQQQLMQMRQHDQLQAENQKLDELNTKFMQSPANVGQLFAQKETGGKILAGIALFLGSAPDGTAQNSALQVMQSALDADIRKQKIGIENQQGVYNQMRQAFGDDRAAYAATMSTYLTRAQMQLQQISSKYKGPMARENAKLLQNQISEEQAKYHDMFQMTMMSNIQKNQGNQNELFVPGYGLALTPKDSQDTKDALTSHGDLKNKLTELSALREKYGAEKFNREAVNRGKQLSKEILLEYKNLARLGVLSKSDEDIINSIVPSNPLSFAVSSLVGQDPYKSQLENLNTDIDQKMETFLHHRGFGKPSPLANLDLRAKK